MDQNKIGKFISECRKDKKITQEELAEKIGVSSKSVSRWENGNTMPDYSIIRILCDELGITINELLSGERIKKVDEKKVDENLDNILKEYYKMKKQRNLIKGILFIVIGIIVFLIVKIFMIVGLISLTFLGPSDNISGIENYNKNYYIEKYPSDLDSRLLIFPDDTSKMINPEFNSSLKTNLFSTDGYILLETEYSKEDFNNEIDRLESLEITFSDCKDNFVTKYVKYDDKSYGYPAYITIDGYVDKYEYALVDNDNYKIIYIYISYPEGMNNKYDKYLKLDKSVYSDMDTLKFYSMYSQTFDNGVSYMEYGDCNWKK